MYTEEQEETLFKLITKMTEQEVKDILGALTSKETIDFIIENYSDHFRKGD